MSSVYCKCILGGRDYICCLSYFLVSCNNTVCSCCQRHDKLLKVYFLFILICNGSAMNFVWSLLIVYSVVKLLVNHNIPAGVGITRAQKPLTGLITRPYHFPVIQLILTDQACMNPTGYESNELASDVMTSDKLSQGPSGKQCHGHTPHLFSALSFPLFQSIWI